MSTQFKTLEDTLKYIEKNHPYINGRNGVYCLKLWRQSDGTRLPIEETKGVRIRSLNVFNKNTVVIQLMSHGTAFQGRAMHTFDSTLYLPDLVMVNVYDYGTEFWSNARMDFSYTQQTKESKLVMLAEWIHDAPRNLRGQWFRDDDMEKTLNDVGLGPKLKQYIPLGRNLDLKGDSL